MKGQPEGSTDPMPQESVARLTDDQVTDLIGRLEAAEDHHRSWLRRLHGALLCDHDLGREVVDPEAHRHCGFGQWYYRNDAALLQDHPDYLALELLHRLMHDSARELAQRRRSGAPMPDDLYELFMDRQELFSQTLLALRDRLREYLYSFDALTGAMTREPFMTLLAAQMARGRRSGEQAMLALIDVDYFKRINDGYGHLVGDRVLAELGQYLARNLRRYDLLCRYGGEEFLVCLPQVDAAEATAIMDRLREDLSQHDMPGADDDPLRVTISVGLARLQPEQDVERSVAHADQALYAAKGAGRNRVISYDTLD